jgi:hypothetical protein
VRRSSNNTDAITAEATTRKQMHSAEAIVKNSRWSQNTAISNNTDAITAEATTRADAITAETLARTTADGLQNTAISNNTDAQQKLQLEQMQFQQKL